MEIKKNSENQKRRPGGRPRKGIKRSQILMVRLTASERLLIEGRARQAKVSPSEWFRQAAKRARVAPRFSMEEMQFLRMLSGLANNFNQLVKLAHSIGLISLSDKCRSLINPLEELIQLLFNYDRKDDHR